MSGELEITDTFSEPYSFTTTGLPSSFSPSVIGIAGVPYLMDTESGKYSRQAFDVVQQRNTNSNRDLLLLPQDVWRQQAESWHQGAGQSNLDRDDALPYRYQDSFGINPWNQWQISLLNKTQRMGTYSNSIWLTTYDNYLAVVNGRRIYWYGSVSASASIGSTTVNASYDIIDIANMGAYVTTLDTHGNVYETAGPGASPVLKGTYTNANFIAFEKDYLIAGINNELKDITAGGAGSKIYTSPLSNFRWVSAAPGNSCIYVLGGSGDKYVVHRIGIKEDGTGLSPAIVAATLPDGEIGYTIESYLGFIFIGTNFGIRVATPNNSAGDLTLGPVIPTGKRVRCFEGQDRFVWYGNSAFSGYYSSGDEYFPTFLVSGLGRLDLATTTTSQLTPAYANDICWIEQPYGEVTAVTTFQGKRVFAIEGNGVFAENDNLMDAGWLTQGTMSFGIEDLKTGLYIQGKWLPLKGSIDLDLAFDSTGYITIDNYAQAGTIRSGNASLNGTQFSRASARYVLRRSESSNFEGPEFTRWEIRAIPVKGRTSRWTLPIMNYEQTEIGGVPYTRDPLAVLDTLMSLVENSTVFTLQESGRAYQVHAKDFVWQPEKLTNNGRAWQGIYTLVAEEVQ
jgi:hypothetical protein